MAALPKGSLIETKRPGGARKVTRLFLMLPKRGGRVLAGLALVFGLVACGNEAGVTPVAGTTSASPSTTTAAPTRFETTGGAATTGTVSATTPAPTTPAISTGDLDGKT